MVEYLGWETTYTEIVGTERLRPKSEQPPISPRTFLKFNISLPGDIKDFYASCPVEKHPEMNADFKKAICSLAVDFVKDEGVLRVLTKDESSQRRAGMLQDMHFR